MAASMAVLRRVRRIDLHDPTAVFLAFVQQLTDELTQPSIRHAPVHSPLPLAALRRHRLDVELFEHNAAEPLGNRSRQLVLVVSTDSRYPPV